MKKTVVFDFDGVIHSYKSGYQGKSIIPDPPVPGIRESIAEIRDAGYAVVVVSTRCAVPSGMKAIWDWLHQNRIVVDGVMSEKPPAICYIDDRAICFDGNASGLLEKTRRSGHGIKGTAPAKGRKANLNAPDALQTTLQQTNRSDALSGRLNVSAQRRRKAILQRCRVRGGNCPRRCDR